MSKRKALLFAGGGYADIPLIKSARKLGYYVVTSGNRPEELGHRFSDEYRCADFSDKEAILALASEIGAEAICPCCNDFSAISCSYAAEALGLPGHDPYRTSLLLHHKDQYRTFARENDIPTPNAMGFSDIETAQALKNHLQFPLIVKPVDLTGGKGISKIQHSKNYSRALEKAFAISKSGRIVVEEFIEGSRHGFSAFLRDGKVIFHFTDDEYYYLNPYLVSGASAPGSVPVEAIDELIAQSEKIARLMKLGTGIFHVQFVLHDRRPVIIEICRRPPGDLYIKLVEHATKVDYAGWIVRSFCGEQCAAMEQAEIDGHYLRHCIMASRAGTLEGITFDPSVKDKIIDSLMFWEPGDPVQDVLTTKFGIVFLEFDTQEELVAQSRQMQQLIHPEIS